jgi:nucleotide-binding universal stress UspA family protein
MLLPQVHNILVAYDGSPSSDVGSGMASILAKGFKAKVAIVHALPPLTILSARFRREFETNVEKKATSDVQKVQAKLEEDGIEAKSKVLRSKESVASTLTDFAGKDNTDLIVAGTRGFGTFKRTVLGSVSTALLNQASTSCPVLVARSRESQPKLRKILAATDGSKSANRAVELAVSISVASGAELTIAHAVYLEPGAYYGGYVSAIDRMLEEVRTEGRKIVSQAVKLAEENGVRGKGELLDKNRGPVWALTDYTNEGKFDLIVTGTRGQTRLKRTVLGSVANGIAHYAHCSVLVTR